MLTEDDLKQYTRAEDGVRMDIWKTLMKEDAIRSMDLGSLSFKVKNGEVYLIGYLPQENGLPLIEDIVQSVRGVIEVHNCLRTNDGILSDVWYALLKDDSIRSLDMGSLSIEVQDGEVYLYGHLAKESNLLLIEDMTRHVDGVVAVHHSLVTDRDLTIQVVQALARDESISNFHLPVTVFHGWIHIDGEVPTYDLQHEAEKIAAKVPNARGVVTLPRVTGESQEKPRHVVQPRLGGVVYGKDRSLGIISRVVIQPENRLVTHIVVRSEELRNCKIVAFENVVPVEDLSLVKPESVFLVRNAPSFNAYPTFDPDEYPLAPSDWKAPYPYKAGEVCWSLDKILEVKSLPESQYDIKTEVEVDKSSSEL